MELKLFNTQSITKFPFENYGCSCGKTHGAVTRDIYFESGAAARTGDALKKILPPLSAAGIITDSVSYAATNREIEKSLARAGFRVSVFKFESSPAPSVSACGEIEFSENVRALIAVGGGAVADIAKFKAQLLNVPLIAVPTTPACIGFLTPSAILFDGGVEQIFKTRPPAAVIADTEILAAAPARHSAAAFGALSGKLTALYDWRFAHIVNREVFCEDIYELGFAFIDEAAELLSRPGRQQREINAALCELSLKFSALSQFTGNSRLMCGGEAQGAHALNILFSFEEREKKMRGEDEFLFARILINLYKNILTKREQFFVPPPDNNLRLEKLKEFFGLDESVMINRMRPVNPEKRTQLSAYKVEEYKEELLFCLAMCETRLKTAWRIFKRLYEDDGYSLMNYLDESDMSLCVALAADLKEKYTMLTYMKNAGYLDAYLIDLIA